MEVHIHTEEPSRFANLRREAKARGARVRAAVTRWGEESPPFLEDRDAEDRLRDAFKDQLSTYSDEALLDDVRGDLVDAAGRYIANDDLCRARRNPQAACDAHLALSDLWLSVVAGKAIESEQDAKGKLAALLHYLHADDQIELPDDIEVIVDQLLAHEGAAA